MNDMDSIRDILSSKDLDEPDEIAAIKRYIENKYDSNVKISVSSKEIIVSAPSAALASNLRMNIGDITEKVNATKPIRIKIG